jgi:hypothetical protein
VRSVFRSAGPGSTTASWTGRLSLGPTDRLLSVDHGSLRQAGVERLRLIYCVNDGGADERRAWQALKTALTGHDPRRASLSLTPDR